MLGGKRIIQLIREVLIGMPTIAVTGANGYIGRHVVKELCDAGATVIAIDAYGERCDDRARLVAADILDGDFPLRSAWGASPMYVCILLGGTGSITTPLLIWRISPAIISSSCIWSMRGSRASP